MGGMLLQRAKFAFVLLFFVEVPTVFRRSEARFKICDTLIKSCFRRVCSQKS